MFQSAVIKLTAWYVGALVIVCLLFSIPSYQVVTTRLQRGAERQTELVRRSLGHTLAQDPVPNIELQRNAQLQRDRQELLRSFIVFNALIILAGSIASYLFARHTLRPIEEMHEIQSRFTADASHEFRTPLATMQTEIETALLDKNITSRSMRATLESTLEEIDRMRTLSNQLLDLSTNYRSSAQQNTLFIRKTIRNEVNHLSKQYRQPITLRNELKPSDKIRGDGVLVRQVIGILVDNAFSHVGQDKQKVFVHARKRSSQVDIDIIDSGPGIHKKDLPYIFDRLYRGKTGAEHTAGHGLGLSIAEHIMEAHHGTIRVVKSDHNGTQFRVSFPIYR
ncbi:MAG TPA: HAMP domain-containing sensor histidine kinase [Candidatus Saccharibacteria bacterium]|nr:HAMP domain-containing sensor histidine kinase [Candidatus Saccharibacteria bacterium]